MDQPQYSTLMEALAAVPDTRDPRGTQGEWPMILGVIASALLCQQRSGAAIAQWVREHQTTLLAAFRPLRHRLPSESTLRRALRHVDRAALEQQFGAVATPPPAPAVNTPPQGCAVDGTYVRGAGPHGHPTLRVSLVEHTAAHVLGQCPVPTKQHERRGVAQVLAGRDLEGLAVTLDAGLPHPALAAQILDQGGDYLMVVKRTQARLYQELTWYFDTPPLPRDRPWREQMTITNGHGRLEQRTLTGTDDLDG